jgi:hypothetical protein
MGILDSDIGLWEQHTVKERDKTGGITATLADDAYPEGWSDNIITGRLVGDNPRQLIVSWHKYVSGRIHAWENGQEAAALRRAEASRTSGIRENAAPEQPAGRVEATPSSVPDGEETLEAILESKVATLRGFVARLTQQIDSTMESIRVLEDRRHAGILEVLKAEKALRAISEDTGDVAATPDPSPSEPRRRGRPAGSKDKAPRVRRRAGLEAYEAEVEDAYREHTS